ncbi:MAG: hypothetical protein JSR51_12190 [Proteobacteria bacterium]|nr:hypothetical protein [Pseudomonadota bacterium]
MAIYLRDQQISNIAIDEDAIREIVSIFTERYVELHAEVGPTPSPANQPLFHYIIRFDNKGYKVFSSDELLRYFHQANEVGRLIFTVESRQAFTTNRQFGSFVELRLDAKEPAACTLVSTSDTKDWAEASFSAVHEVISKYKTKNGFVRSPWTNLIIQLFGVVIMFLISLWAAFSLAPQIKVENPFVISFLFILLILSNIWTYLNPALLWALSRLFPNVDFVRSEKARLHWLIQTIVGSAVFALVVYILGSVSAFLLRIVGELVSVST